MTWDRATAQALPSSEVTHLHLFRHGRVDTGGQRLCYGHSDYPLSSEGLAQVDGLVRFAAQGLPPMDGILSSDLRRCTVIAEPLAERLGVPLLCTSALREQNMGAWEGQSWERLTQQDIAGVRAFWASYASFCPPGGESFGDMGERIEAWFKSRWDELRGRRWLVVAHTGVVRSMAASLLGLPWSEALRFTPLPGTHSWFMVAQAGACVQVLGERPVASSAGPAGEARAEAPGRVRGRPPRLALSGSAGTGKTTLGRLLADRYGVPYIPEGMRARIAAGVSLHDLGADGTRGLIQELWEEQVCLETRALAEAGGFVSDRSPLDYFAFWLNYQLMWGSAETEPFFERLRAHLPVYDRVLCLPWGVLDYESDGVRSPNVWVQRQFQSTVEGLLQRELPAHQLAMMPDLRSLTARSDWVDDMLRETGALAGAEAHADWASERRD